MKIFDEVNGLGRMMDYHMERHSVLSSNLTNAQTPGYRSKDLVFENALDSAVTAGANIERTHAGHIPDDGADAESSHYVLEDNEPVSMDNNDVRLEKAMAQVSANKLKYETGVEVMNRRLAILRYAASDGNA